RVIEESPEPIRFGGIGFVLGAQIEKLTGIETRTVVMGHLQRGGVPTPFDRILATKLGAKAVDMIEGKEFGYMVGIRGNSVVKVPLDEAAKGQRTVPPDDPLVQAARSVGTSFGD
ncbi:MAG: 6-phosphofructokinase, partial [Chloroflexi bacterium]|nr:6-phosphofructokinase [Chloroflexota bacterium]